jgi:PAS domain S-box-containing protein
VNRAGLSLLGYAARELLGQPVEVLIPAAVRSPHVALREKFLGGGETRRMAAGRELHALRKDGSPFPAEVGLDHIVDGGSRFVVAVIHDLTEQKRAERILRDSELRLRLALEGADLGLWDLDVASGRLAVNDRWMTMLGLDPSGPPPTIDQSRSLIHPDDLQRLQHTIMHVTRNPAGQKFEAEVRMRHADGRYIWILERGAVVERSWDGRPQRLLGTNLDITARKHAESTSREAEQRLRAVIEASPVPFSVDDLNGKMIFANRAFFETFGYRFEEVADLDDWWRLVYPDSELRRRVIEFYNSQLERCARTGWPSDPIESIMRCKDGTKRIIVVRIVPLAGELVANNLVVLFDVTEQRRLETGILEATSREQHRLGMDLHDGLGQQLTVLSLMLSALSRSVGQQQIPQIESSLADLARHTVDCVAMARAIAHGLSPVAVGPGGFERSLQLLGQTASKLSEIEVMVNVQGLSAAALDNSIGDSVYRIVQEALGNAAKHGKATRITIDAALTDKRLIVSVTDNGIGLHKASTSDGLGLGIMRYRARALGGRLEISSSQDGGTVVRCECPAQIDAMRG